MQIAVIKPSDVVFFGVLVLLAFFLLVGFSFYTFWQRKYSKSLSPYSGLSLRRGEDLPYGSKKKILQYIYDHQDYDNRFFELRKAAVCRETGRIFPDSITWLDTIKVDWGFLRKRFPGDYVSWGSLTPIQQTIIKEAHESLEGFQTEISSPESAPRAIEQKYAYVKPGPLYVDLQSKTLLGWKCIADTEFEVLVVQRPKRQF